MIPLSVPNLGAREAELVQDCMAGGWISSAGRYVGEFEDSVRSFVGAEGAVAVSSGTTALHLALHMAGVRAGDEVILPSLTFIAPANAVRQLGGWPVFVDVDPETWQIAPACVLRFLEEGCRREGDRVVNTATGRTVTGLLPVHVLGHPAPMDRLDELAETWGLFVVEDAAESLGARFEDGSRVGSKGRLVCFSFNGNKVISTGGGGMIVSDDVSVADRGRFLSTQAKSDPEEYVHSEIGFNYRLTNLQAAVGVAQMERLEGFLVRKSEVAARYRRDLVDAHPDLGFLMPRPTVTCSWWLFTVLLPEGVSRRKLRSELAEKGIQTRPLWQPLHHSPALAGAHAEPCPVSEAVHRRALSLPSSTGISDQEVGSVIDAVRGGLGR